MSQDINLIVTCSRIDCPYNHEKECGKEVLYINDLECESQESEDKKEETEYQRQAEQYQYDTLYELTFDLETGSM